jgi:hypothetical protein
MLAIFVQHHHVMLAIPVDDLYERFMCSQWSVSANDSDASRYAQFDLATVVQPGGVNSHRVSSRLQSARRDLMRSSDSAVLPTSGNVS